jgi:hypothetical protein
VTGQRTPRFIAANTCYYSLESTLFAVVTELGHKDMHNGSAVSESIAVNIKMANESTAGDCGKVPREQCCVRGQQPPKILRPDGDMVAGKFVLLLAREPYRNSGNCSRGVIMGFFCHDIVRLFPMMS